MSRPLLSLVMIVKDEASNIKAVLEAAKPHVDCWTILDTGSTDGTLDIIREVMIDVPGRLFEEPFIDFATSRNRVMELDASHVPPPAPGSSADGATPSFCSTAPFPSGDARGLFQLMLSGDEYLGNGAVLREHLEKHRESNVDCHMIQLYVEGARTLMPRVLRTNSEWKYVGEVHETPKHPNLEAPVEIVRGAEIQHIVSDPERRIRNIAESHIPLLERLVGENPLDERNLIFLAQSYNSILPHVHEAERITLAMQAMSLYKRRLDIPTGTVAERNYCMMQYLDNARLAGIYTPQELHERCRRQAKEDPHRPETALLQAITAWGVEEPKKVYLLARNAIEVAIAVERIDNVSTVDLGSLERAHHFAATVAHVISQRAPKDRWQGMLYAQLAKEHAREIEKKRRQH